MTRLTPEQIRTLVDKNLTLVLDSLEDDRAQRISRNGVLNPAPETRQERAETVAQLDMLTTMFEDDLAFARDDEQLESDARKILRDAGIDHEQVTPASMNALLHELGKSRIKIMKVERERHLGRYDNAYDGAPRVAAAPVAQKKVVPLLSEAQKKWLDEKALTLGPRHLKKAEAHAAQMLKLLGDRPVDAYQREDIVKAFADLQKWPKHAFPKAKDLSLEEILKRKDLGEPLADTTAYLARRKIAEIMKFCFDSDWVDKVRLPALNKSDEETSKVPFSDEELDKLFTSNHYSKKSVRTHNYWAPLIGLLSGMRIGEICQLGTDDIRQVDGIWCFDINSRGDRKTKNKRNRLVPVHHFLIEHGLLEYAEGVRSNGLDRLFPSLKRSKNGDFDSFNSAICQYIRRNVTKDKAKTFHCLRKNFSKALKSVRTDDGSIAALLGHSSAHQFTASVYSGKMPVAQLNEAVQKIDFPCLRHLARRA